MRDKRALARLESPARTSLYVITIRLLAGDSRAIMQHKGKLILEGKIKSTIAVLL